MFERLLDFYRGLSRRIRTSVSLALGLIGIISTGLSIWGITLSNFISNRWGSFGIVLACYVGVVLLIYFIIGRMYNSHITLFIHNTPVEISCGDVFKKNGFKVIACDTHFDTRVDDVVISKKSLHGQLFLNHGNIDEIKEVVKNEACRLDLKPNADGSYDFPLGTVIKYESSIDNQTYLMLALTKLDENYEAHTSMADFEHMLMHMWKEVSRVYASNDLVFPVLGTGITRFDDGPKDKDGLLRCLLCTMNSSGVTFNSKVNVVIWGDIKDIPLYEYKDLFYAIPERRR